MSIGRSDCQCSIAARESQALGRCSDFTFAMCGYKRVLASKDSASTSHELRKLRIWNATQITMVACSIYIDGEVIGTWM